MRALRDVDPRIFDALLALALSALGLAIVIGRSGGEGDFRDDDALGAGLLLMQTMPLAVRRTAPIGVAMVISIALVAHSAIGYEVVQAGTFSSLIAVYGAASLTDARRALLAAGITAAAIGGFFGTNRGDFGIADIAGTSATWAVAWTAGSFVRMRGEQAEIAGARAARLEAEQEIRAREAVADERARMARELHDIVGHALNVIVIQAAGARRVFDSRPEVPRDALASIESTGREALTEMERMLGVLRAAEDEDGLPGPQPGLAQLEGLAANVSEAGIAVKLDREGPCGAVPASVQLSAYRIVQESLTNSLKHSGASHATVTVRCGHDELDVEIVDDGRGAAGEKKRRGGRGQLGMRERVALFGGEISMGPASSAGGYRVQARLPFKSASG